MRSNISSFSSGRCASLDGRTVMVVDDDRVTRRVLERMLADAGYRVEHADHGEKCLFICLQKPVDAFVVDLRMPGMNGIELCRRIRSIERYKLTPIVVITSSEDTEDLTRVFDAGADDYILKPVHSSGLMVRLKGHLQKMDYFRQMTQVRENLNRYVSTRAQSMVEAYSATGSLPSPEQVDVCVMFTDVRGFTALSQTLEPTTLFYKLSRHLGMQVDCVHRHGGYVDKFAGDGIMAVFDTPDRAARACHCALEIIRLTAMDQVSAYMSGMALGIGVHKGPVLIGNIGSEDHLDYSAIGATVNLAARLCGCADPMSIVVSDTVAVAASEDTGLKFVNYRKVDVRGIEEPVQVAAVEFDQESQDGDWDALFAEDHRKPRSA